MCCRPTCARQHGDGTSSPTPCRLHTLLCVVLPPPLTASRCTPIRFKRPTRTPAEREPKRHRANPKGTVIKSFCKNPACGKQLTNGRANTCHHCGYDLAAHRREAQLDKLLRAGPMAPAQVRSTLKEAAQEVHVRSGGAAVVLTLVYQQPLQQQQVAQQAAASGGQEDEGGAEGSAAGAAAAPAPAPAAATAAAPVGGSVQTIGASEGWQKHI